MANFKKIEQALGRIKRVSAHQINNLMHIRTHCAKVIVDNTVKEHINNRILALEKEYLKVDNPERKKIMLEIAELRVTLAKLELIKEIMLL